MTTREKPMRPGLHRFTAVDRAVDLLETHAGEWMTGDDMAARLGVNPATLMRGLYRAMAEGRVPELERRSDGDRPQDQETWWRIPFTAQILTDAEADDLLDWYEEVAV